MSHTGGRKLCLVRPGTGEERLPFHPTNGQLLSEFSYFLFVALSYFVFVAFPNLVFVSFRPGTGEERLLFHPTDAQLLSYYSYFVSLLPVTC